MTQEPDWTAEARRRIDAGERLLTVARDLGVCDRQIRIKLNLNGAADKLAARRMRERAARVGVRIKTNGLRRRKADREQASVVAAYSEPPAPLKPTLPRISMPAYADEPILIRFVPRIRREPEGVERIRQIHRAMIRAGRIPEPDLLSVFNA